MINSAAGDENVSGTPHVFRERWHKSVNQARTVGVGDRICYEIRTGLGELFGTIVAKQCVSATK